MCEERGLVVGDVVRVKKQVLQCYTAIAYKKFAERTGTVEKLFIPLGGLKQRARVLWHKWGNRGKEFHDVFYVRDLEAVPANSVLSVKNA